MGLVGYDSLVGAHPHHESKCDMLGLQGSRRQVFPSAEDGVFGRGMERELGQARHDSEEEAPDIRTEEHTP